MPGQLGLNVLDYNGRRFRPVEQAHGLTGSAATSEGVYHQAEDLIWAEFSGASVRVGRLVGRCGADGVIDATYCYVTVDGATVAGSCVSTPTRLPDGRIRLTERWRRVDGSTGVSQIEEIEESR